MRAIRFKRDLVESEVLSIPKEAISDLQVAAITEQQNFLTKVDSFVQEISQLPMFGDCSSDIKFFFENLAVSRASLFNFNSISADESKELKTLRKNLCHKLAEKYNIEGVFVK